MAGAASTAASLVAGFVGLAALAGALAAAMALAHRWYARTPVPRGLAVLAGLSGVAIYLNTTTALGQVVAGATGPTDPVVALYNIAAFLTGGVGALTGRRAGDRFAADTLLQRREQGAVGRFVRSVGRVTTVDLPEEVADVVGYDPVPAATKERLAGRRLVFPRNLTVEQLRERVVERLKTDHGVGHVDVTLTEAGTVEWLAVGARLAGIGHTLPPATTAVALRADPAFAASPGDVVQVWESDPPRRVVTGELRGTSGDVVTVAIDAADTQAVDPTTEYRLVTLPVEPRPDREFATLLRQARETFSTVTVGPGSVLAGLPVGALSLTVAAVRPSEGELVPVPGRDHRLRAGDTLFAVGETEALRRLTDATEAAPAGDRPDPALEQPAPTDEADSEPADLSTVAAPEEDADADTARPDVPGQASADAFEAIKADLEADDSGDAPAEPAAEADADDADQANQADNDDDAAEVVSFEDSLDDVSLEEPGPSDGPAPDDPPDPVDLGDLDDGDDLFDVGAASDESVDDDLSEGDEDDEPAPAAETDDADTDEEEAEDDNDRGDDDGDGGGKSFQELKAEFESGDADWEDEVGSPGGDMALDPDE